MRKSSLAGVSTSTPSLKSESGVVQSSLKRRTGLISAQYPVPPSKVQPGRVGIPGDFSVPEVRVAEITEGIYDLSPQNCSWSCSTVTTPQATQGRRFDTFESSVDRDARAGCSGIGPSGRIMPHPTQGASLQYIGILFAKFSPE